MGCIKNNQGIITIDIKKCGYIFYNQCRKKNKANKEEIDKTIEQQVKIMTKKIEHSFKQEAYQYIGE